MSGTSEDFLASLATEPWRPKSLQLPRKAWPRLHWRVLILVGVVMLHAAGIRWLMLQLANEQGVAEESALLVDFVSELPPMEIAPLPAPDTTRKPPRDMKPRRKPKAVAPVQSAAQAPLTTPSPSSVPSAAKAELQLYDRQGRVQVPDDILEQIDRKLGDKRVFSYQIPRLDDADKLFSRNPPIAYETTRFEKYWKPDQDVLTELLTQLVEKSTREIRIPVPGHPGSTMVCRIAFLALSGGCGVLSNGANYVGPVDDPATLSPEEDRQCQAWWEQIIGARTQDQWRSTRALYEQQCRKPLARAPSG